MPEKSTDFATNLISEITSPNAFDVLGLFGAGVGGGIAKLTATGEKMAFGEAFIDSLANPKFIVPNEINATAVGTSAVNSGLHEGSDAVVVKSSRTLH